MSQRHDRIVNVEDVEVDREQTGDRYAFERRQLGVPAGAKKLGCSHMVLPPGKSAWPRHWHGTNEEAYFILGGSGLLELGDERVEVRAGDYVALPPATRAAHRLTASPEEALVYLALSTMIEPDVSVYPDSGKVGVFAGAAPGRPKEERSVSAFLRLGDAVEYWDGEDVD